MRQFKELGIQPEVKSFTGDKIKIERVLGKEIIVNDFKIVDSKFTGKGNGRCLHLQITKDDEKKVLFSGSSFLMSQIEKIEISDIPFKATIIKVNDHFEFS